MTIWVDAQISPFIALWINSNFPDIEAKSVRSLKLQSANDKTIFDKAREEEAVMMSKDYDFVKLIEEFGHPPKLIWITSGNTSNARMCDILGKALPQAITLLDNGEAVVEISG